MNVTSIEAGVPGPPPTRDGFSLEFVLKRATCEALVQAVDASAEAKELGYYPATTWPGTDGEFPVVFVTYSAGPITTLRGTAHVQGSRMCHFRHWRFEGELNLNIAGATVEDVAAGERALSAVDIPGLFREIAHSLNIARIAAVGSVEHHSRSEADTICASSYGFAVHGEVLVDADTNSVLPVSETGDQLLPDLDSSIEFKPPTSPSEIDLSAALSELDSLVGLAPVKAQVHELSAVLRVQTLRVQHDLPAQRVTQHLVFTGNPGTGKTTVARILGRIYRALGYLPRGHLVEADRSSLVAEYVGQTAIKTHALVDRALGGCLFIDEAYALAARHGSDYGREAIDTLLKRMEDEREDFVLIVAGYPSLMEEFLASNPGLRSRFARTIDFPDYSNDELLAIIERLCRANAYDLSQEARHVIVQRLEEIPRTEGFGNGRLARQLFENAVAAQATRIDAATAVTRDLLATLVPEDFEEAARRTT